MLSPTRHAASSKHQMQNDVLHQKGPTLWLHIAAGVCVGIVAAAAIIWLAATFIARMAAEDAARTLRATAERAQRQAAEDAQARADEAEAARQRAAKATLANQQAKQREQDNAARRELAWTRFYKKPAECDESRGGAWTTDCANNYIRARTKFSELYDAGKL